MQIVAFLTCWSSRREGERARHPGLLVSRHLKPNWDWVGSTSSPETTPHPFLELPFGWAFGR